MHHRNDYPDMLQQLLEKVRSHEPSDENNAALWEAFRAALPAIRGLVGTSNETQVSDLVALYGALPHIPDAPESEMEAIEAVIESIGSAAVPVMVDLYPSVSRYEQAAILYLLTLVATPDDAAAKALVSAAPRSTDEILSTTAEMTLTVLGDNEDLNDIIQGIEQAKNSHARQQYAYALARIGGERAVNTLLAQLERRESSAAEVVTYVICLEQIGTEEAIEGIRAWMGSEIGEQHIEAVAEQSVSSSYETLSSDQLRVLWEGKLQVNPHSPLPETERYYLRIAYKEAAIMLRDPRYADMVAQVLESLDAPRAQEVLQAWKDERGES